VQRAVVLTQHRRVTDRRKDRRTDGIGIASTALAMRAMRRAVKSLMTCSFIFDADHTRVGRTNERTDRHSAAIARNSLAYNAAR